MKRNALLLIVMSFMLSSCTMLISPVFNKEPQPINNPIGTALSTKVLLEEMKQLRTEKIHYINHGKNSLMDNQIIDLIQAEPDWLSPIELSSLNLHPEKALKTAITISFAGDVTLGGDEAYGYEGSFFQELNNHNGDMGYFFRDVKQIFEMDDLTIVNLETTLTTASQKAEKKFRFRAPPSYVDILKEGSIEAVSLANNHTYDYLQAGYIETRSTLDAAGIYSFGNPNVALYESKGVLIGLAGFNGWNASENTKTTITEALNQLKDMGVQIFIVMFHWGNEREYYPNSVQKSLAEHAIDQGADLVVGCHPHVLQGIGEYKGRKIIYSLGNFCFGGNKNPKDKDTMIYQHSFILNGSKIISEKSQVIPCSISSQLERNDYQPILLDGFERDRVMMKINELSQGLQN